MENTLSTKQKFIQWINEKLQPYQSFRQFGCLIENGWADASNPQRFGYIVSCETIGKSDVFTVTDGKGSFWKLIEDSNSKLSFLGKDLRIDDLLQALGDGYLVSSNGILFSTNADGTLKQQCSTNIDLTLGIKDQSERFYESFFRFLQ